MSRAGLHSVARTDARCETAIAPRPESTGYTEHVLRRAWDRSTPSLSAAGDASAASGRNMLGCGLCASSYPQRSLQPSSRLADYATGSVLRHRPGNCGRIRNDYRAILSKLRRGGRQKIVIE